MQIINKLLRLQKVYIFFISFVLFIIIFFTTYLYANTFKVSNVEISSPFRLNFNKNRALDKGFQTSFLNLLTMITTSGDKKKIKNTSTKEIKAMIDSFTISGEKFANNEYFATLETTFNKKNVLKFLERKNIFPSMPIKNNVLLIPILIDTEKDNIYLFNNNIFYKKWNNEKKNYQLLNYLLPNEDLEDLDKIQEVSKSIDSYDFLNLIKKYDLNDYIILTIYKDGNEVKTLSKVNLNNSLKVYSQKYTGINLDNNDDFQKILESLKITYEDYWKKNNEINTSIKLPITLSIKSKKYKKIKRLIETINASDLISNFYILKFDSENILYRIIYNGSPKTFFNNMSKSNFNLVMENNIWTIR